VLQTKVLTFLSIADEFGYNMHLDAYGTSSEDAIKFSVLLFVKTTNLPLFFVYVLQTASLGLKNVNKTRKL
jgi:hypothetical protein